MEPYLFLILGILLGVALCSLVWLIWVRSRTTDEERPSHEALEDDALKARLDELTILHAIATVGAEAIDENVLIERAIHVIGENLYPNNFGVLLVEVNGDRLWTHPSYREDAGLKGPEYIPVGEGICGQVALLGESRYVPDVRREQNYIEVDPKTRSELCVPMKIGERVIGVLNAEREQVDGFRASDDRLLSTIAGQLATAIDRLRAESAVHQHAQQLAVLSGISQEIAASLIPEQVFAAIHQAAAQLIFVDSFLIALQGDDRDALVPVYYQDYQGPGADELLPEFLLICAPVIAKGNPVLIENQNDLKTLGIEPLLKTGKNKSVMAVPLRLGEKVFGVLAAHSHRLHAYSPDDLETIEVLANQAAIAIENARLFEETQQQLAKLAFLSQIIAITATENDLTVALNLICEELAKFLQVPEVSFALLNSQLTMAQVIADYQAADRPGILGKQIPIIGNPVMTSILESGTSLVIEDTQNSPLILESDHERAAASLLVTPIIFGGEVVGMLEVVASARRKFDPAEITLAEKVTSQVGQVLERLGLFAATRDQAERMAQLATLSEGLNRPLSLNEVISSIGSGAIHLSQADRAALFLRQEGMRVTAPWFENLSPGGIQQITQRFDELPGGILFSSTDPILIGDTEQLPQDSLMREFGMKEGFRGVDIWPLIYQDDAVAAVACYFNAPHAGSETEHEVMLTFARQSAAALVNAQLFDEARRRTLQLEAINAIIIEVSAAQDLEQLLQITLEYTLKALGLHAGGIWVGEKQFVREMPIEVRKVFEQMLNGMTNLPGSAIAIQAWDQLEDGDEFYKHGSLLLNHDLQASLIVPLFSEGRLIGGLGVVSPEVRMWSQDEIALVEGVSRQLGGAIERITLLERIQENAQQVQHIIDTVPEGVILLDEEKRLLIANPVAQSYLKNLARFSTENVLTHLAQKPISDLLEVEQQDLWYEIEHAGPPRQIFEIGVQSLERSNAPGGWVVAIREVTKEKETQSRIQMQERLATVGQLAAGIAHDFNNILAAIVVYADLLKRDPNLLAISQERVNIIEQQVHRAASLIRQILDFSRRSVMEPSTLDLLPFIKELDKLLRRILPETIELSLSYKPGIYLVKADPSRLQQVFMNLAVNARDASEAGGVLEFEIDHMYIRDGNDPPCPDIPPGSWNRISVKDSGMGISPEVLPHIFEPFFTTKPVGEGTGLGLAQAYGIIKQHGGYIDAHSVPGEGTIFHIYLPAQQTVNEPVDFPDHPSQVLGSGEKILLVEDDRSTQEAMKTLLEDSGYKVIVAADGLEAFEMIKDQVDQVDLVISDLVMPAMGGVELFNKLSKRWPGTKMLLVTGHPEREQDKALLETGNVHWLNKPFSVGEFKETVYSLLHD